MVSPLSICREWTNITTPPKELWRKLGMYTSTLHCELLGKRNQCPWNRFRNRIKHISYISRITGKRIKDKLYHLRTISSLPRHNRKIELPGAHSPKLRIDICSFTSMRMESKDRYITLVYLIQTPCRPHPNLSRRNIRRGLFRCVRSRKQPEMWDEKIFREIFSHLSPGGILSTYCAKGEIRRRLQSVEFTVERLPGPPNGKREILRASKR